MIPADKNITKTIEEFGNDVDLLRRIVNRSASLEVPQNCLIEKSWEALENKIKGPKIIPFWTLQKKIMIAAILIICIGIRFLLVELETSIVTAKGEMITHELPDGSKVTLNASSSIQYDYFSFGFNREVKLEGEAFFEVKQGSTFDVIIDDIKVSVLGTSFNIFFREGYQRVECLSGLVMVESTHQKIVLNRLEGVVIDESSHELHPITLTKGEIIDWQTGTYEYENEALERVASELEIQYGVKIMGLDAENRFYTGRFDNTNLNKACFQIFRPLGLNYQIEDSIVNISEP